MGTDTGQTVDRATGEKGGPDTGEKIRDRRWIALAVLCTSVLVLAIDTTILNVALPSIGPVSYTHLCEAGPGPQ